MIKKFKQFENQTSDIENNKPQKYFFNDFEDWNKARMDLPTGDDDINFTKSPEGELIAFWYDDAEYGWIKK